NEKILSPEQELTVKMAEAALSDRQREEFARRQNSVRIMNEDEESRGEGPSSGKGKGVDPRNWGATQLDNDEMNPEVQAQLLDSFEKIQRDSSRERRSRMHDMFEEFQAWQQQETERFEAKMNEQLQQLKQELLATKIKREL
ncbi:hypothetical protein FB446DRAFT_621196, partial [Lentinula raphanica]